MQVKLIGIYSLKLFCFSSSRYFNKPQFHKDGLFLVKYGSNFIATAFAWQEEEVSSRGKMRCLGVLPEHRKKGIAKALCYHVLQYHKDNGKNMAGDGEDRSL